MKINKAKLAEEVLLEKVFKMLSNHIEPKTHYGVIFGEDRGSIYGSPEQNHRRISELWSGYLDTYIYGSCISWTDCELEATHTASSKCLCKIAADI